ncbi:MAG TPA: helix-turn-helix domain-containing protein [Burkholderiaceae bacterium]|nr:helix-turn-helix domain-containing protein [Burkholderiaceae bacterium]
MSIYTIRVASQLRPYLKDIRIQAGKTQTEVAQALGITQQSYAQLEAAPEKMRVERFLHILQILGYTLNIAPRTDMTDVQADEW